MSKKSEPSVLDGPSHGRRATSPSEIPPRGWKDIFWRIYGDISESRILLTAAGVTFYLLLSLVPTLTAFRFPLWAVQRLGQCALKH